MSVDPPAKTHIKVALMGPAEAGKSTLSSRYADRPFPGSYRPTIGADFATREIFCEGKRVIIQIWDFSGQERYRTLALNFPRGSQASITLFDVTSISSFSKTRTWLNDMDRKGLLDRPHFLVACKCDALSTRAVSQESGCALALEYGASYFETSALQNEGLDELFDGVIRAALIQQNHPPPLQPKPRTAWLSSLLKAFCCCAR